MTILGINEHEVTTAVTGVTTDDHDGDSISERFARAAWSAIVEPGDSVAGELIQSLGAVAALEVVIEDRRDEFALAVPEFDADDIDGALARWRPRLDSKNALGSLERAAHIGASLLVPADSEWPDSVDDLGPSRPVALWLRGRSDVLSAHSTSMSIVGARAATGYGEHVAVEAAAGLVDRGYTIVSGAAYGIDGTAHRAALASSGQTIAILAGGVDRLYPSGHDALLRRIVEEGAVISELPCGSAPTKWRFLARNRLIAALSLATIVVEAGWRSGSLSTAGHAAALGRPLGAVPGPITSAASHGCHRLIRDYAAVCVTTVDEMAELAPLPGAQLPGPPAPLPGLSSDELRVLDALSTRSPRSVLDIAARAGLAVRTVQSVLGALELTDDVVERESGWMRHAR